MTDQAGNRESEDQESTRSGPGMSCSDLPVTEQRNPNSMTLDRMTTLEMLALFDTEDHTAVAAVAAAASSLARVAERVADTYRTGGRILLLGAGTSGRIAAQEVAELPATFGIQPAIFQALISSGAMMSGSTVAQHEDDTEAIAAALTERNIGPGDVVIGVAASGETPFVLAGIRNARAAGAWTIGLANNPDTSLLIEVDEPVLLATGPEVVTGSTRLKAGTAQKVALNRISTIAMILCGRVTSNVMTELTGSADKLKGRAIRIVAELGKVSTDVASQTLEAADWHVRTALTQLATFEKP